MESLQPGEGADAPACLPPWFALRVRSRFERVASIHLRDRGFEEFTPSYTTQSRWSDRNKQVVRFLFPGYVFCRMNLGDRRLALTAPGVVDILGFGAGGPEPIPEEEILRVRKMVDSGLPVMPWPFLKAGQMVLVEQGPLSGVEGILERFKGKDRLVISVTLLQRSVSAEIERQWVRPIGSPTSGRLSGERPLSTTGRGMSPHKVP